MRPWQAESQASPFFRLGRYGGSGWQRVVQTGALSTLAYDEGPYPERVRHCTMIAHALVETLDTYREGSSRRTDSSARTCW